MPGVEHPALKAFLFLTIVLQTFPPATQLQERDTFFFCIYIVCTRHYDTIKLIGTRYIYILYIYVTI